MSCSVRPRLISPLCFKRFWLGLALGFSSIHTLPQNVEKTRSLKAHLDLTQKHQVGSGERPWVWAGDFNQELTENEPVPLLASSKGAQPLGGLVGTPTRWKGRSTVDHVYSNHVHLCSKTKTLNMKICDHKPLWFSAQQPWFEENARHVLPPGCKWKQPENLTLDERRKELEIAWQNQSSDSKIQEL